MLIQFPDDPLQLPTKLFDKAYATDDPPVLKHLAKLQQVASNLPMRSSSNKLSRNKKSLRQQEAQAQTKQQSELQDFKAPAFSTAVADFGQANPFAPMMQMCMSFMQKQQQQFEQRAKDIDTAAAAKFKPKPQLQMLAAEPSSSTEPTALVPAQEPAEATSGTCKASPQKVAAAEDSQEQSEPPPDYEQALFEKLKARKNEQAEQQKLAKPQGKGKGRGRGKGKGRGQKQTNNKNDDSEDDNEHKPCLKRPAGKITSSNSLAEYKVPKPTKAEDAKPSYVDKHYHKARKLALSSGLSEEVSKARGRLARAQAVVLWEQVKN